MNHRRHIGDAESGIKTNVSHDKKVEQDPIFVIEESETNCEVCHSGDREHLLLLCDGCDLGYHTTCLVPQLSEVPLGQWFCPTCTELNTVNAQFIPTLENTTSPGQEISILNNRSRSLRSNSRRRSCRRGGNLITRTGQVNQIDQIF